MRRARKTPPESVAVRFEVTVPATTPRPSRIFLAGDGPGMHQWDEAGVELQPVDGRTFFTTLQIPLNTEVNFKVTRGSWATVETSAFGQDVPNRQSIILGPHPVRVRVAGWRDRHQHPPGLEPIEGKVSLFGVDSRILRGERRVWVYTPPASCGPGPFPLLMCLDGQNVFHHGRAHDSMPLTWGLDVTADKLIRQKRMSPVVIAAVANSRRRAPEYTPWKDPYIKTGGEARKCFTSLRDEFMPAVAAKFPAKVEVATNGILGSSLGGLFSFWAVLQEPSLFTRAGVVSPAFFWGQWTVHQFLQTRRLASGLRIWMDVGTNEVVSAANVFQDFYLEVVRRVRAGLENLGLPPGTALHYEEIEFGGHNEADWAARSDRILTFLYPPAR